MSKEVMSLKTNNVYDLMELPDGKRAIVCKEDISVKRYKARLVAQGFARQASLDYDETFCPVVRYESIRYIVSISVFKQDLNEEVYMKKPPGFTIKGNEHLVCKLKQSLYGLKQAPRCWNATLDRQLRKMGFEQNASDPCLHVSRQQDDLFVVAIYVDPSNKKQEENGRSKAKSCVSSSSKRFGRLALSIGSYCDSEQRKSFCLVRTTNVHQYTS